MKETNRRKGDFFEQLNLSPTTLVNYKSALNSSCLKSVVSSIDDTVDSIFEITDLDILWKIYSEVNLHPVNIRNHRGISCAVMKYIKFLNNGKKYVKQTDCKKTPKKMKL